MRRVFLSFVAMAGVAGCHKQAPPPPQAAPTTAVPSPTPSATQVVAIYAGKRGPDNGFDGPDGKPTKLADFKGKPLLVNLWATWCVPCVKEMPELDALAGRTAGRLTVLAIDEGLEKKDKIDAFWKAHGYKVLKPSVDKNNGLMLGTHEAGLPVTILYDKDGKEVARVRGPLDWNGAQAKDLLSKVGV